MAKNYTGLRRNSMACVAFPTCGLAMAESERYLPSLITKIEDLLDESGLKRGRNNDSYDRLSQWMCETSASRNSLYR